MKREETTRLFRSAGFSGDELGEPLLGIVERFADLVEARTAMEVKEKATAAMEPLLQKSLEDAFMQGAAKGAELERNACADGVRRMRNNVGEVSMRASIITETCDFIEQAIRARKGGA